jgi:multicomponent Na+:H+ antiporter subunit A
MEALVRLAAAQTRVLQSGYLRQYLVVTIVATVALVGGTLMLFVDLPVRLPVGTLASYEILLLVMILGSTAVAVRTESRLGAVAALGITGYAVALVYLNFGAPDLAMTQVAIETLTVMLFLLALRNVPSVHFRGSRVGRARSALVALSAGTVMGALVLVATTATHPDPVSGFFLERALPDGHGRNVVNVILVDFRALDTLGELAVLSIAGVGVYALLRLRPGTHGGRQ